MVNRRPHSATISWKSEGYYDENIYVPGTEQTLVIDCLIEPTGGNKYIVNENGDKIPYSYKIFCDLFDEDVPETAKIIMLGKTFKLLCKPFKYQKHVVIKV